MGSFRTPANKGRDARKFNRDTKRSHVYNRKISRGGWRL